jgi:hypothetical protein
VGGSGAFHEMGGMNGNSSATRLQDREPAQRNLV